MYVISTAVKAVQKVEDFKHSLNPCNLVDNKKSTDSKDDADFMLRIAKQLNPSKRSYASIIQEQISIISVITLINKKVN